MSMPIVSLPETIPTHSKLQYEAILEGLVESIGESDELKPLLRPLRQEMRDGESEARAWYTSMFESVRNRRDFEKILDKDVPNEVKDFLRDFATGEFEPYDQEVDVDFHPPTQGGDSTQPRSGGEARSISEPPLIPPSPHIHETATNLAKYLKPFHDVLEGDGKPMECIDTATPFENWGLTVNNSPSHTFVARTEEGLRNLVKWAARSDVNKKVRVAGDFYSSDGEILVMMLPIRVLAKLPACIPSMEEIQKNSDLVGISDVAPTSVNRGALCTVKAGTTNDMFREWCLTKSNRQWCIPFNVIMVEITLGGSNGPICHGAGFSSTTLSDLVVEFHYIDPHGESRIISDPDQLRAASGCFGMLGICTALTLRLDAMAMAVMNPVKVPLVLAIPPPVGYKIPDAIDTTDITVKDLENARQKFIKRCEEDYYLEWFWFPFTKKVWVNTWKKVDDPASIASLQPYPSRRAALWQWLQAWLAQKIIETKKFQGLNGRKQALLLGEAALSVLPNIPNERKAIRTLTSEAVHFRRGIQNMRCLDSEWEIPIPEAPGSSGKRDYSLVQRAWWDAISCFYSRKDVPMRLTLEMRLTGGSNVILAPQRGNDLGTASIEVLTVHTTPGDEWQSFLQQVADAWTSYKGPDGALLNSRPHWAKEWKGLTIRGRPIKEYLREVAYNQAIPEFRAVLEKVAEAQGITVADMRRRFGNPLLEEILFSGEPL